MRYKDEGNVHLAFHGVGNACIRYLREEYGMETLREIFRRTAQRVYKDIYERLKEGDSEALAEHWEYYLQREGGEYTIARDEDQTVLTISRCPAIACMRQRGLAPDEAFCKTTKMLNDGFSEGTPLRITTEILGDGKCIQTIKERRP